MMRRNNNSSHSRKIARAASTSKTKLSLAIDPTDIVQHAHTLHDTVVLSNYHHQAVVDTASSSTSTLDMLSSITLAKASNVVPNQSLAPLTETIQSIATDTATTGDAASNNNMVELIPDMPSMPGGVPRTGNAFLSGSFRELYQGTLPSTPLPTENGAYWSSMSPDGTLTVPAKELDLLGRYSDLLNRIPLAAAMYALIDFFIINAEEDMAIAELMLNEENEDDENEVLEAIMDVENKVVFHRFLGLLSVVTLTIIWSLISYHPVPLNELL